MALRRLLLYGSDEEGLQLVSAGEVSALNRGAKAAKRFERDLQFLRALVGPAAQKEVVGRVAEEGIVWVAPWGRLVRVETTELEPGTPVRLKVYCDASQRNWKRRLVLSLLPMSE